MYTTSDFKKGLVIQLDGAPCLILDVTFQSPSARGANTMVRTKYRNLITGQVLEKAFRSGDKVDEADFERHKGQFLYADGGNGMFMDLENYEQFEMSADEFEPLSLYLLDGTEVVLGLFEGRAGRHGLCPALPRCVRWHFCHGAGLRAAAATETAK